MIDEFGPIGNPVIGSFSGFVARRSRAVEDVFEAASSLTPLNHVKGIKASTTRTLDFSSWKRTAKKWRYIP